MDFEEVGEMNYKTIVMIALALCLCFAVAPAAAVWQNGNWFSEEDAPDVVYDSVTDVSSKYVPIDNSIPTDWCGALHIQTLTHHALIGAEFTIQRINPINVTFVNGARIQKEQAEALETIAPANTFTLDHNGAFDDRYVRGAVFLVTLLDGNGGQPEYAIAEIFEFHRTDVVFVGHGVSGSVSAKDVTRNPVFTIIVAKYGEPGLRKPVTDYFIANLVGNTISTTNDGASNDHKWLNSFIAYYSAFSDPAPGIEKGIRVRYSKDGVEQLPLVIMNVNTYSGGTTITLP